MKNAIDGLTDLGATIATLGQEMKQAAAFQGKDLTWQAAQRKREEMMENAKQAAAAKAADTHQRFDQQARTASEAAMVHRPVFDQNDIAQITRTRDAWEMNILPQLQAGKDWSAIIPNISRDDALAIERFAPTYVKANSKMPHEAGETLGRIQAGVWSKHAALADTEEGRAAILEADRAARRANTAAVIRHTVEHANNVSDLTAATIELKHSMFAEQ